MLGANGEGVTVSVSTDPMLLLYDGGPSTLAAEFATPANSVTSVPENIGRGEAFEFQLATSSDLQVIVPPFWEVDSPAGNCYRLSPPPNSAAREVEVRIRLDGAQGELYRRVGITER